MTTVTVQNSDGTTKTVDIGSLSFIDISAMPALTSLPASFAVPIIIPAQNGNKTIALLDPSMGSWKPGGSTGQYIDGTGALQPFPSVPAAQVQSDWSEGTSGAVDFIKNKPTIPSVLKTSSAFSLALTGSGATGTQIHATKDAETGITYKTSTTCTLAGSNTSVVQVKTCSTNSATESDWVEMGRTEQDQPTGISLTVGQIVAQVGQVVVPVPAGWFVKAVASGTGTHAETSVGGWKTIFG